MTGTMLPNTRTSRSRFSSPATISRPSNDATGKEPSMDKSQELATSWVEPARQNVASYQEAGLVKGGVVENMHALGTLPKPAFVKKLNAQAQSLGSASQEQLQPKRQRIVLKNKNGAKTPTGTPTPTATPRNFTPTPTLPTDSADEFTPATELGTEPAPEPASEPEPEALSGATIIPISAARRSISSKDIDDDYHPKSLLLQVQPTSRPPVIEENYPLESLLPQSQPASRSLVIEEVYHSDPVPHQLPHPPPPSSPRSLAQPPLPQLLHQPLPAQTLPPQPAPAQPLPPQPLTAPLLPGPPSLPRGSPFLDMARRSESRSVGGARGSAGPGSGANPGAGIGMVEPQMAVPFQAPVDNVARVQNGQLKQFMEKQVRIAVDEAIQHNRYPTAWALRTLYDENSADPHFLLLVESIYRQTANADALLEFKKLISRKKREGEAGHKGFYYFEAGEGKNPEMHKAKPAPYADLVTLDLSTIRSIPKVNKVDAVDQVNDTPVVDVDDARPVVEQQQQQKEEEDVTPARKKVKTTHLRESSARKMAAHGANGANGAAADSPLRHKTRAGSVGSESSGLSSARSVTPPQPPAEVGAGEDAEMEDDDFGVPARGRRRSAESPSTASGPGAGAGAGAGAARSRPMTARARAATKKKNANMSPDPNLQNNSLSQSRTRSPASPSHDLSTATTAEGALGMPAAVASPLFPRLPPKKGKRHGPADFDPAVKLAENDQRRRLQQAARHATNSNTSASQSLSWERPHMPDADPDSDFELPAPSSASVRPRPSLPPGPPNSSRATRSQKRQHDEVEDDVSPTSLNFQLETGSNSAVNSRAGTPNPRAGKRPRTGLRVKSSPIKQKTGPSAGIPRPSGAGSPALNGGAPVSQDENEDICSSCGGNGELVCCDGCTRSFHFRCVDPPIDDENMPDAYYCPDCFHSRFPTRYKEYSGPFGGMLEALQKKNSSAFRLPKDVQGYFEGVKAGVDGEYEDFMPPTKAKKNKAAEQETDFYKLCDAEGNAVICHSCNQGAAKDRAILPCTLCSLNWHIDCLDPPQANPPVPRTFRCPLHIDDLLAKIPGALAPAHKFRKIKGASVIKPGYTRGNINNGWIEVQDDSGDDKSGWRDPKSFGRTWQLPSKGIMQDFLSKILSEGNAPRRQAPHPVVTAPAPQPVRPLVIPADEAELERQQAALNILRFSRRGQPQSSVATLITTLVDNAHPAMISMMARGDGEKFNGDELDSVDRQSLLAMQQQMAAMQEKINAKLARSAPSTSPHMPTNAEAGDNTAMPGSLGLADANSESAINVTDEMAVAEDRPPSSPKEAVVEPVSSPATTKGVESNFESAVDSIANLAAEMDHKINNEPAAQAAAESALTPISVSEVPKGTDDMSTAILKEVEPTMNGMETPETETNNPEQDVCG